MDCVGDVYATDVVDCVVGDEVYVAYLVAGYFEAIFVVSLWWGGCYY